MTEEQFESLAWAKMSGLLPAAVQDADTGQLLMLGYMNRVALAATLSTGKVTFYSRSKQRLWQKGETSGNTLALRSVTPDCDNDALLVRAVPAGPTCHRGTTSCFGEGEAEGPGFLAALARIVATRAAADPKDSYTARLLQEGPQRIAQKLGEEGVELALAAVARDKEGCVEDTADLLYHLTVLMQARGYGWDDVAEVLKARHRG